MNFQDYLHQLKLLAGYDVNKFDPSQLPSFIFALLLCALLCHLLSWIYVRYGTAVSNRLQFSRNFLPIGTTTMLIIAVVKNSLTLSLGLVGALSIIRFRTAIKEPEELAYLFITIAIGLGCGSGSTVITTVAFTIIAGLLLLYKRFLPARPINDMYLQMVGKNPGDLLFLEQLFQQHGVEFRLKRSEERGSVYQLAFAVKINRLKDWDTLHKSLKAQYPDAEITLLEMMV